ncbi:cation:proton antiporter [Roseospira goensis]|uniref:Kef-type K+ transport system membrane component KefB n=1 Tax=Roseospira goensis TaxID=391922 RepID=A0A7W6WKK1_9PROT|nr:cation:proton antiporter [Roseospira goensis]MBB4285688.1 Kef-type K+ transport system membrane component KefB [Roseospira goensis]
MIESPQEYALLLLLLGTVTLAGTLLRSGLARWRLPAMAGFILIGVGLSGLDTLVPFLTPALHHNLEVLAKLGVVVLLFRVGLESDLGLLVQQLRNAAVIWLPNMAVAAALAFLVVSLWPGYGLIPALFVAVAASATSIGVSTAVWEESGHLNTPRGALLLDVAELDDVSAVILLSMLFAMVPILQAADNGPLWSAAAQAAGWQIAKLALFCLGCYLFSRRLEKPLTAWFHRLDPGLGPLVFAAGATFLIAAVADLLGFSMAIGALFAGLAFSRDPAEREIDRSFAVLYTLFAPFFFVVIGVAVNVTALHQALGIGLVLLGAAVLGKLLGAGLPAALVASRRDGLLIGVSMVPRAEIFLIVMLHGVTLGDWAVPERLYTAAVLVSLVTCIAAPVVVQRLLATTPRPPTPADPTP